jgi:hypothetical protein
VRRRAAFGLLDASGWTWATLQALFWFLFIIFMLGYIPNVAYYFVVSPTVKVGYNFASIVNWCPSGNEDLPCPAPSGALLPWQTSPPELALPAPLGDAVLFQSGTSLYLIGGRTGDGASSEVLVSHATLSDGQPDGNLTPWQAGPALPEPRSDAALGVYLGVPYVVGGLDASGAPTDTVFKGLVEDGVLTGWELADGEDGTDPLTLPRPISDAAVVTGTSGFVLIGGRDADGRPIDDVHVAWVDEVSDGTRLLGWQPLPGLAIPEPRAQPVAGKIGDFVFVVGGEGPDGPTDSIFRLELPDQEPAVDEAGRVLGWAVAQQELLPEARAQATGFAASGSLYVIGGVGEDGDPQDSVYWVVPDPTTGDLTAGWQHLDQTDLAVPLAGAPMAGVGSTGFLFGGTSDEGLSDGLTRAGLAPAPPFFQLGLFGATIPAMAIEGEVGQQLGYMAAAGVATANFVILVLIGVAYSHQAATKRLIARLSRGRLSVPPEEVYRA